MKLITSEARHSHRRNSNRCSQIAHEEYGRGLRSCQPHTASVICNVWYEKKNIRIHKTVQLLVRLSAGAGGSYVYVIPEFPETM